MLYRVTLKRLVDGKYYARCISAPNGLAEGQAGSPEEALEKVRKEIRYQLEYCPCSGVPDDYVELHVEEAPPTRVAASKVARYRRG